jgi:acyl-CoA reductase-like NAD-dependent aldehyde dehydrogenase
MNAIATPVFTMSVAGKAAPTLASFDVIDPATEQVIAQAPDATEAQLDQAVAAARAAFPDWSGRTLAQRAAVLKGIAGTLREHQDELARLLSQEQGKPLAKAQSEIMGAAFWLTEIAAMVPPVQVLQDTPQALVTVRHVPLGVVGSIVPWNFPIIMAAWKIAPALLTGNTLVLKPSPFTPLTTLRLGELLREQVPAGVLNIISGGDALGPWMSAHRGIDKIAFTGSTATGRKVMESASRNLKRLTLELGGNDPAIVMPDVDVEAMAPALFWGAFGNSGQICVAAKRIYVHEAVYDKLAAAFVRLAAQARMGAGTEPGVELGPVQNRRQFERLKDLLADSRKQGHHFLCGGELPGGPGYFFPVTLVDNPPEQARIVQEEPFGPILPLLKFKDLDDVIARANASQYGLAASVWCRDEKLALQIAERLQAGTVWINEIQTLSPHKPFAGRKQSGMGVENAMEGLLEYTAMQTLSMKRTAAVA